MLTPLQRERLGRLRREQQRRERPALRLPVEPPPLVRQTEEPSRDDDENRRGVEVIDFSI